MVSYAGFIPVMLVALVLNLTPCRHPLRTITISYRPKWTATIRATMTGAFSPYLVTSGRLRGAS